MCHHLAVKAKKRLAVVYVMHENMDPILQKKVGVKFIHSLL